LESVAEMWETFHNGLLKLETVELTAKYVEKSVESVNTKSIQPVFQQKTGRK